MRVLANENFPRPSVLALRALGVDVESVAESMPGATDRFVLKHAVVTGRWLLTFDRDYGELVYLRAVPPPPAIIYLRQGSYPPEWPGQAVFSLLQQPLFAVRHLVVVDGRNVRRRPLPRLPSL